MNNITKNKKRGFWNGLKLRGRLLTIMLAVALTAVLVCAVSFIIINNHVLDNARTGTQTLSDNVTFMVNSLIFQQETALFISNSITAATYLDGRLTTLMFMAPTKQTL